MGVKYPKGECARPGCTSDTFNRAGMIREPKAMAPRDELRVRGTEHAKFLKSVR